MRQERTHFQIKMFKFLVIFAILMMEMCCVLGEINCYTCISQGGGDDTCIKNPAQVPNPISKCKYKYCTVRRIEYASEPGKIQSFLRGCEQDPLPEGENASQDVIVWARSCNYANLCNTGDGLTELKPGRGDGSSGGVGDIIVVPSTSAASLLRESKNASPLLFISISLLLYHILFH